jgi:PPK2 family polyphosphate:nucleotide phosphotransferase
MPDLDKDRIRELVKQFRVEPGTRVKLPRDFDPDFTAGYREEDADELLRDGIKLLAEYQARLSAQDTQALLVVIQAIDAAGKDGTIQHVMSGVNPQGVTVSSFKVPSPEEMDHDFMWRYNKALPPRGMIGIFNRSYYEELLVVRVHPQILMGQHLPPDRKDKGVWTRRFRQINDWEAYLSDQGYRIVKLFLNLSKEEQRERFLARIDEPDKNWKFSAADVKERAFWDDYQAAFADVLSRSSSAAAPWYVIPADHKWFARIVAAGVIANALIDMDPEFPEVDETARAALLESRAQLMAEGPDGAPAEVTGTSPTGAAGAAGAAVAAGAKGAKDAGGSKGSSDGKRSKAGSGRSKGDAKGDAKGKGGGRKRK